MPSTLIVNRLTVVHKDSGGVSTAFPDVCKTPTPAGPVPLPYPNVAQSADTAGASRTVKADGNPIMLKSSYFAQSSGDEAGSAMGVVSNKIKGKAYPKMYSFDVKVEGENVFRLTDLMLQNGGSPTNTPPGAEVQGNQGALGGEAAVEDPETAKVVKLAWSRVDACCGDEAALSVTTENCPDGTELTLRVHRAGEPDTILGYVDATIRGGKDSPRWVTRRGPYKKEVKATGRQRELEGQETTTEDLLLKAPEPGVKELIGPKNIRTPAYVSAVIGGKPVWKKHPSKVYGWEACYFIELKAGSLCVTRRVDFDAQPGAHPTRRIRRMWQREIENVWDAKFRIHRSRCKRGNKCDCPSRNGCCAFLIRVACRWGAGHGKKVKLYAGANDPSGWGKPGQWWYSHDWWMIPKGVPPTVRAHEFGHLIGMYDEYLAGACEPSRKFANIPTSVMSSGRKVFPHHMKEFHEWFRKKAGSVIGPTRLLRL